MLTRPSLQYFTIKPQDGIVATSYSPGDRFYIDPGRLLSLQRFLPQPKGSTPSGAGRAHHDMQSVQSPVHDRLAERSSGA